MKLQVLCVLVFIYGVSCMSSNVFRKYLVSKQQKLFDRGHSESESKENGLFDDDEVVIITCGEGEVISMVNANYGNPAKPRKSGKGGKHGKGGKGGKSGKNKCSDPQSLEKAKGECNGKTNCEFTVSDLFNEDDCINEDNVEVRSGSNSGNDIQLWLDYQCIPHPCLNFYCAHGGTCKLVNVLDLIPQCDCLSDWTGDHCDDDPCEAIPTPCPAQSTCTIKRDGGVGCCCDEGYTGDQCDTLVDGCTVNPCKNEGTCQLDSNGLPECICKMPFMGPVCTEMGGYYRKRHSISLETKH